MDEPQVDFAQEVQLALADDVEPWYVTDLRTLMALLLRWMNDGPSEELAAATREALRCDP